MNIIVFGNSYIMRTFINSYKDKYNFIVIDRSSYDINSPNYDNIKDILDKNNPDIIIDSICPILPIYNYSEYNMYLLDNTLRHINYINKLIEKYNVRQLIYLSSAGIIYTNESKEENYYNHINNLYGLLKIQSECLYKYYASSINTKCQYQILRISNVYGNFKEHKTMDNGIINIILKNHINNQETHITSSNISKNYIYIYDLCDMIDIIINKDFNNNYEIINIGSPYNYTINDIINIISSKFKLNIKIDNNKIYNNSYFTINIDKLQHLLNNYKFTKLENYINTLN